MRELMDLTGSTIRVDLTDENHLVIEVYGDIHDLTGSKESHVIIKDVHIDEFDDEYPSKDWRVLHEIADGFYIVRKREDFERQVL